MKIKISYLQVYFLEVVVNRDEHRNGRNGRSLMLAALKRAKILHPSLKTFDSASHLWNI